MPNLTLTGVGDDGAGGPELHLVDDDGTTHTLALTDEVRAALAQAVVGWSGPGRANGGRAEARPSMGATSPRETSMTTTALRPREIQARIRSGESAEAVAATAGLTVEKIMPFAGPVLAERAHVAERAQRSTLRRAPGDTGTGTARTLGDAVAAQLRSLNVADDVVEWDAWRREDGRWTLVGAYETSGREGSGRFSYDPRGNFVVVHDDDARWLVGEGATPAAEPETSADDDLSAARRRRLAAVPENDARNGGQVADLLAGAEVRHDAAAELGDDLGDDVIGMVHGDAEAPGEAPAGARVEAQREAASRHPEPTLDSLLPLGGDLDAPEPGQPDQADQPAAKTDEAAAESDTEDTGAIARPKRPSKRRGRTSVPSWDEIMFGGGDS